VQQAYRWSVQLQRLICTVRTEQAAQACLSSNTCWYKERAQLLKSVAISQLMFTGCAWGSSLILSPYIGMQSR
jgi:hypothetical protein